MSDHEPPARPKRGSSEGYDPFAWAREVTNALNDDRQPSPQEPQQPQQTQQQEQSEDELRDYKLFRENERVRRATAEELMRLLKEGKFDIVSEFRYRRWELREWIDDIERLFWSDKDKESEEWR